MTTEAKGSPEIQEKWKEFEIRVENVYQSLGFKTQRNSSYGVSQLDLVAEKTVPGAGLIRLLIECKWKKDGSVSNQEVLDFCAVFEHHRSKHGFASGALVTNNGFTEKGVAASQNYPSISLKTIGDLERELFDVVPVCLEETLVYEKSHEFWTFIPMAGRGRFPQSPNAQRFPDLAGSVMQWIESSATGFLGILAEFGAGKTTLLHRINYLQQKRYMQRKTDLIPLFVPLRFRKNFSSADALIEDRIFQQYKIRPTYNVFSMLRDSGRILFLLDGFDEIESVVDKQKRAQLLLDLVPIISSKCPVILTCRDTYFYDRREYNLLVSAAVAEAGTLSQSERNSVEDKRLSSFLYGKYVDEKVPPKLDKKTATFISLDLFDASHIDQYLQKYNAKFLSTVHMDWRRVKKFLGEIYDISDLMKRPILLSMIVDTVLLGKLRIDSTKAISGPSGLYSIYTDLNLDRESGKGPGRNYFSPRERKIFCHLIALQMLGSSQLEVTHAEILQLAFKANRKISEFEKKLASEEATATDIRTCSFLAITEEGHYRFTHKSFMEFFVAQHIYEEVLADKNPEVILHRLPKEIIYFLSGFSIDSDNFEKNIWTITNAARSHGGGTKSEYYNNLIAIVLCSGSTFRDLNANGAVISDLDFAKALWTVHRLNALELNNCALRQVRLDRVIALNVVWRSSVVEGCDFEESEIEGICEGVLVEKSNFVGGTVNLRGTDISFRACSFRGVKEVSLAGDLVIDGCAFNSVKLRLECFSKAPVISRLSFQDCTVVFPRKIAQTFAETRERLDEQVKADKSFLVGLLLSEEKLPNYLTNSGLVIIKAKGNIRIPEEQKSGRTMSKEEAVERRRRFYASLFDKEIVKRSGLLLVPQWAVVAQGLESVLYEYIEERFRSDFDAGRLKEIQAYLGLAIADRAEG